jgi:Flp pilus assembly protein TadG
MRQQQLEKFASSESGNVVTIFAVASIVIVGVTALAVDYSSFAEERSHLQAVADAGALHAARELSSTNPAMIADVASTYAKSNLRPKSAKATVATTLIPPDSVKVQIEEDVQPILSGMFNNKQTHITVKAVAKMYSGPPLCVLGLDPAASGTIQLRQMAIMTATNCAIASNSTSAGGLTSVDMAVLVALNSCSSGGIARSSVANFIPRPFTDCPSTPDPFASRPAPTAGPCRSVNTVMSGGTTATLNPGTYCGGLTLTLAAQVKLNPGVYIIKDGPLAVNGGATVQGKNVSFYLTGSGATISWDATSHISLTAPNSGELAGILIYEDPSSVPLRQHTILSNDARMLLGTIYLPQGKLVIASSSIVADLSAYTVIVARMLGIEGSAHLVLNTNYNLTDIPLPDGVGNRLFNKVSLTQ